jgi:hypothetical protein
MFTSVLTQREEYVGRARLRGSNSLFSLYISTQDYIRVVSATLSIFYLPVDVWFLHQRKQLVDGALRAAADCRRLFGSGYAYPGDDGFNFVAKVCEKCDRVGRVVRKPGNEGGDQYLACEHPAGVFFHLRLLFNDGSARSIFHNQMRECLGALVIRDCCPSNAHMFEWAPKI